MYKNIFADFLFGVRTSTRVDLLTKLFLENYKFRSLILKIIKYNMLLHIFPYLAVVYMSGYLNMQFPLFFDISTYSINFFSVLFHTLHFMDLINICCTCCLKTYAGKNAIDMMSLSITMLVYQFIIFATTTIIDFILRDRFYFLSLFSNVLILSVYHSFYCYNNLWQHKNIKMFCRIDMHEKLWPYYIGYGAIATILYLHIENPVFLGIYNLYTTISMSIPFLVEPIYPKKNSYPSMNLNLFSYMTNVVLFFSKKILGIKL
jgi:hypothetical protein